MTPLDEEKKMNNMQEDSDWALQYLERESENWSEDDRRYHKMLISLIVQADELIKRYSKANDKLISDLKKVVAENERYKREKKNDPTATRTLQEDFKRLQH